MRDLTLVMAYYENPGMLAKQLEHTRVLSKELRKNLRVIVVDDGSPDNPAQPGDCGCPLEIYRIEVDVRWNQDAARNIGVHHCRTEWFLVTDMDHMVPEQTWSWAAGAQLEDFTAYKFSRVTAPQMSPYKPHPNSYLMTRALWKVVGGYDERFAGYYGTDGDFRDRLRQSGSISDVPMPLIRVPREYVPDASTTRYARKSPEDKRIGEIKQERSQIAGWRPKTLSFPYRRTFPTKGA